MDNRNVSKSWVKQSFLLAPTESRAFCFNVAWKFRFFGCYISLCFDPRSNIFFGWCFFTFFRFVSFIKNSFANLGSSHTITIAHSHSKCTPIRRLRSTRSFSNNLNDFFCDTASEFRTPNFSERGTKWKKVTRS